MNKITPLKLGARGPDVVDLQEALQLFLDGGVIPVDDERVRKKLSATLKIERTKQLYDDTTKGLVTLFQKEKSLRESGDVDQPTADAMNAVLKERELPPPKDAPKHYVVSGQVRREDDLPVHGIKTGLKVRAFHESDGGGIGLGDEDPPDAAGRYTIRYELLPGVDSINLRVSVLDADGDLLQSSEVIRDAKPLEIIDLTLPMVRKPATQRRIAGRIMLQHGLPADKLKLRLYRLDFGGKATLLNETSTLAGGQYAFTYDPGGKAASLEVRVVNGANEEIPLSKPLNDLSGASHVALNLVAPATLQPLEAEYRRLIADLKPHIGQINKLADVRENAKRQDLTVLNRATGWDARLIALASTAERLNADAEVKLPQEALYGLLRAGLPSEKLKLAQVEPDVIDLALKTVRNAGIVRLNDGEIDAFKKQFATFATKVRLSIPAPGSRSTYGELLKASGLSAEAQDKFAPIYLTHRGDASQLWDKASKAGLKDAEIGKLQLQGKLAFLAGNSGEMTDSLMKRKSNGKPLINPVQLVDQDFHRAAQWKVEIENLAGGNDKKLAALIPAAYVDDKVENRLEAYAQDMARKIRLSYPTQVVGRLIEQREINLPAARDATVKLLKNSTGQGFRLGQTPVESFFKTHGGVMAGMTKNDIKAATQQLKTLQRVYQVTPTNEAMQVLMNLGMTSAFDVMLYSEEEFTELYNVEFHNLYGTEATQSESNLIYRKAEQVDSVTYNLFTIAKKLENEPEVAGMSAPMEMRDSVRNELIKQFPTMETLFGSMDFCECEHCRSVLSPAAYLVDLLQFLDPENPVWENFLNNWKATHEKERYQKDWNYDHADEAFEDEFKKPYYALIERRPDLPHIALTCENTHTALPYIDIVNEILEYYVANGKLEEEAGHDTGEATTAELLAEPQNVIRGAYDKLREARYPLALPFDLWIETVRRFCEYFETPLVRTLEVFRSTDDLFAPAQPFDRFTIFMESLGLSSAEVAIFTESNPIGSNNWYGLYGLPTNRPAIKKTNNADNSTLPVANPDAHAEKFWVGLVCTYFDVSANALSAESKTISAIGAPDSGGPGSTMITFAGVWTARPDVGDLLDASATLRSAKTLSRRLGVTYKELAEIIQTGFVNPKLVKLGVLYKLGVSIHDARFYLDHKGLLLPDPTTLSTEDQKSRLEVEAFALELETLVSNYKEKVTRAELDAAIQAIPFNDVLVLADPDAGCDFDLTTLRYANGAPADPIAFLRINLFVRLWRKLGWSIEETDCALTTFTPSHAPFDGTAGNLVKRPLKTALIYLAHLKALGEILRVGKRGCIKLLALWSDIPISGKKPLYAELFLSRSVLKSAPVFDHPLGKYLQYFDNVAHEHKAFSWDPTKPEDPITGNVSLRANLLALQGALGLTADEISYILTDAGKSIDMSELSLPNVSLLYRHKLLANALKLSVRELIGLKQLSGLDPFKQLHPEPLVDMPPKKAIEFDYPFSQTLRFVEVAQEVKDSGLKIDDLEYLLRHRFDETGKYRPNPEGTLSLLKTLAEGVRAIRAEHAVPDDPSSMSEEVLKQKLGLVLPPDVVERFLAMMNGTAEFTATKTEVTLANKLDPAAFTDELVILQVSYNPTRQEQKLTMRGVLFDARKNDLKGRLPKAAPPNPFVPSAIFGDLLEDVKAQAREFFVTHLQKQPPGVQPARGFLDAGDFDLLFDPNLALAAGETEQDRVHNRGKKLANAFLPFLQQRLIRQFIVQTMTAYTAADPMLVESLLTDERLLADPKPLLEALTATGDRGISADFFDSVDGSGVRQRTSPSVMDADTGLKAKKDDAGNPLNPANSARFKGYLEVPTPGAYRFYVALGKQNAEAELRFDHLPDPLFWKGVAATNGHVLGDKPQEYLELKPGVPYRFSLDLKKLNGGDARLLVQGETMPKDSVSQLTLYPLTTIQGAQRAVLLMAKALQLVQTTGLSEREIRYLLNHSVDFAGLNLSQLPTGSSDDTPEERLLVEQRFAQYLRLAAYARLKRELAGGTDDLIGIFEANEIVPGGATDAAKLDNLKKEVYPLIAKLTRRDEAIVQATAESLVAPVVPAFGNEKTMQRLWDALQVVERFGVPIASLVGWTRIVNLTVTKEQRFEIARDVKETIKARFEPETWQRVAQPIFDKLRQRQRDALAAYVMHQRRFERIEQLYEYFLIDPGMEPVVQTSRIRLATASVQLFIQRSLLNMELHVHPSLINSRQWEWMKRYRVWEANRKIFLFPENWLEPEFRDDKTHLFAELEGALLQGDVSSDLVEDAFLTYLKKLDELARLDIAAMHLEDNPDPALRTLHVIGRTYSQPHKYFYRRYAHQMWTPWEPVSAEIEGDHLAPVVWRDRLYLFWVTFMEKAEEPAGSGTSSGIVTGGLTHGGVFSDLTLHEIDNFTLTPQKKLTDMTLSEVSGTLASGRKRTIEAHLHWSEYLQGEWSTRESSNFNTLSPIVKTGLSSFDSNSVFIHVSKEEYENGEERGVYIHLGNPISQAFYLAGRNSTPTSGEYKNKPKNRYSANDPQATRYSGRGPLTVTFAQRIITEDGAEPVAPENPLTILQKGDRFTLLLCDDTKVDLKLHSLIEPVFYQDKAHTLFVEPSVTERRIEEWQDWITRTSQPESGWLDMDPGKGSVVVADLPKESFTDIDLRGDVVIDSGSLINPVRDSDWLVNPVTALLFDDVLIGPGGQSELEIVVTKAAGAIAKGTPVNVNSGSGLASDRTVVFTGNTTLEQKGLRQTGGGLNVVGSAGFNLALKQNLTNGAGLSGVGRLER